MNVSQPDLLVEEPGGQTTIFEFKSSAASALEAWLREFPEAAIRERINEIDRIQAELQSERDRLVAELARWEALRSDVPGKVVRVNAKSPSASSQHAQRAEVILELLGEHGRMSTAEIRRALIERNLIADDRRGRKAVDFSMHVLAKDNLITRVEKGVYEMSSGGEEASAPKSPATSGNEERGEGGTPHSSGVPSRQSEGAPGEAHPAGS